MDNVTYSSHRWPSFLPDGKHFLYIAINHASPSSPETGVFIASLDGKENRLLFHTLSNAIYASGHLLFMRDNSLVAQPFDPGAGKFTGDPQQLMENVQLDAGLWRANLSASTGGVLIYASGVASGNEIITWYDRSGKVLGTVGELGAFYELALSPDEKKVAVADANSATATIWIHDLSSKLKARLSFSGGVQRTPIWSPDGRKVAFMSNQQANISVQAIDSGAPAEVLLSTADVGLEDWSRDGRYLLYSQGQGLNLHLWVLPLFGDRKPFRYGESAQYHGEFSPDGRWVAYGAPDESGNPAIFVAPFPWTGAKWQISNGTGQEPHWRADGKEIYYHDFSSLIAVEVNGAGSAFQVGNSGKLFVLSVQYLGHQYAPSRDGQRFIAIAPSEGSSQTLNLVQNWTAELRKK